MVSRSLAISSSRFGATQAGEPTEGHVEDVVGLLLGEVERARPSARSRAAARSSDARMAAMTRSSMSMALSRPSTMWARASALRRRNCVAAGDDLDLVGDVVRRAPARG